MARWLTVLLVLVGASFLGAQSTPPSPSPVLDFATYRDRVQPVFLDKRAGLARCYVCHSQGTPFRLQRLSEGATSWNEEETRKNFEAIQRLVIAGKPEASRLLLMPLAHEAGGTEFHPGGKRWTTQSDPEWKELAQWIKAAAR
jgi:hypothetical protein